MAVETKFSIKCKKRNKGSSKEENDNFKRLKKLERRILKAGGINQLNAVSLNMISSVPKSHKQFSTMSRKDCIGLLRYLQLYVATPICKHFGLRIPVLFEQAITARKAGVTIRKRLIKKCEDDLVENFSLNKIAKVAAETSKRPQTASNSPFIANIGIRLRQVDDVNRYTSLNSQLAVLLHELAHLKHMNHGVGFMLFLKEIYQLAGPQKMKIFRKDDSENMFPSPWLWERKIYDTEGNVSDEELLVLFEEQSLINKQKQSGKNQYDLSISGEQTAALENNLINSEGYCCEMNLEHVRDMDANNEDSHKKSDDQINNRTLINYSNSDNFTENVSKSEPNILSLCPSASLLMVVSSNTSSNSSSLNSVIPYLSKRSLLPCLPHSFSARAFEGMATRNLSSNVKHGSEHEGKEGRSLLNGVNASEEVASFNDNSSVSGFIKTLKKKRTQLKNEPNMKHKTKSLNVINRNSLLKTKDIFIEKHNMEKSISPRKQKINFTSLLSSTPEDQNLKFQNILPPQVETISKDNEIIKNTDILRKSSKLLSSISFSLSRVSTSSSFDSSLNKNRDLSCNFDQLNRGEKKMKVSSSCSNNPTDFEMKTTVNKNCDFVKIPLPPINK